ncbi:GerMN domain-containing protein [Actinokineospora soli]|uniref:GerMN domain-containing protein n=1 Tax=Actinokineospora soli TaxID=1048753 RepID=A0ABW2TLJ5_9PSEU
MRRLTACLGAALLALGACTTSTPGPTTTPTAPATPPVTTTAVTTSAPSPSAEPGAVVAGAVYFLRGERVVPVRRELAGPGVAASAVRELLAGPSASERAAGMSSSVPDGTALRGVSLAGGTATVDLSGRYDDGGGTLSMTSRLAQVVFTLTQFSTVERVQFRVDGVPVREFGGEGIVLDRPRTRADFEELTPEVLVDSPRSARP